MIEICMTIAERRWNLWVRLDCIGVVSRWCCKEVHVYRFPHITYPYSNCISYFLQQHPYLFVHFSNVSSFLFRLFFSNIANIAKTTFEIVQKSS